MDGGMNEWMDGRKSGRIGRTHEISLACDALIH